MERRGDEARRDKTEQDRNRTEQSGPDRASPLPFSDPESRTTQTIHHTLLNQRASHARFRGPRASTLECTPQPR